MYLYAEFHSRPVLLSLRDANFYEFYIKVDTAELISIFMHIFKFCKKKMNMYKFKTVSLHINL